MDAALTGKTGITAPIRFDENPTSTAYLLTMALIPGDKPLVLLLADDVHDFSRVFEAARPGQTGETFVVDRKGRMASESRYTKELISEGLVPQGAGSALNLELRNPTGFSAGTERKTLPFSVMAADVIAGKDGENFDGFFNYRHEYVIGAWTKLEGVPLAVATYRDWNEPYRSLIVLRWLFGALLGIILAIGGIVAYYLKRNAMLARRARHAEREASELGQYRLEYKIGEGGMGAVYSATHRMLKTPHGRQVDAGAER